MGEEEVGPRLRLRGIIDRPVSFTGTRRKAFSGFGLLSSYRLIDFGDVVPWSFNTQFANPPFKTNAVKCNGKEEKRNSHRECPCKREEQWRKMGRFIKIPMTEHDWCNHPSTFSPSQATSRKNSDAFTRGLLLQVGLCRCWSCLKGITKLWKSKLMHHENEF